MTLPSDALGSFEYSLAPGTVAMSHEYATSLQNVMSSLNDRTSTTEYECNVLDTRVQTLENKIATIENLLGIKFGEDGGIKVMKEKE